MGCSHDLVSIGWTRFENSSQFRKGVGFGARAEKVAVA
jgi:hypothetical protein